MAFITNQKQDGAKKLGDRLGELMGHSERLDMLVGFFFFSGVKVLYDALRARANMSLRVLVGMEAEFAMGQLVESLRRNDDNSANAIKARFLESMRKIVGSGEVDTKAFHERLDLFVGLLESGRLELRKTRDPNHAKLYIFTMDAATKTLREKVWITGSSNFSEPGLKLRDELNVENLYIFNFFPTVKGSTVVNNREIAQTKMFAIHRILGEDAQIFSLEEEPSASALYDKLSKLDDESQSSCYTRLKCVFARERKFLEKSHPEILERINAFPSRIKTAWESDKTQPHATLMFRRHGATFSVVVHSKTDNEISEWMLPDAIEQIACKFDTPREPFTAEFWEYPTYDRDQGGPRGIYEVLKQYRPKGLAARGGLPDFVTAGLVIGRLRPQLSGELREFAALVAEDIQTYGTIPVRTIRQIARCDRIKDQAQAVNALADVLEQLRELRGDAYLDPIRRQTASEAILVTIEKH